MGRRPTNDPGDVLMRVYLPRDVSKLFRVLAAECEATPNRLARDLVTDAVARRFPDKFPATTKTEE